MLADLLVSPGLLGYSKVSQGVSQPSQRSCTPSQDDTDFAHRAKATRNRWALSQPFKSKGEAARDLRRHAAIALGSDAFWPASVLVKVGRHLDQWVATLCLTTCEAEGEMD